MRIECATAATLRMSLVLPNGRPKGLHVAEEGAWTAAVVQA